MRNHSAIQPAFSTSATSFADPASDMLDPWMTAHNTMSIEASVTMADYTNSILPSTSHSSPFSPSSPYSDVAISPDPSPSTYSLSSSYPAPIRQLRGPPGSHQVNFTMAGPSHRLFRPPRVVKHVGRPPRQHKNRMLHRERILSARRTSVPGGIDPAHSMCDTTVSVSALPGISVDDIQLQSGQLSTSLNRVDSTMQEQDFFDIDTPMSDIDEARLAHDIHTFCQSIEPPKPDLSKCWRSSFLFSHLDARYDYLNLQRTEEGNYSCTGKTASTITG